MTMFVVKTIHIQINFQLMVFYVFQKYYLTSRYKVCIDRKRTFAHSVSLAQTRHGRGIDVIKVFRAYSEHRRCTK